jgi:hypothetical protein
MMMLEGAMVDHQRGELDVALALGRSHVKACGLVSRCGSES